MNLFQAVRRPLNLVGYLRSLFQKTEKDMSGDVINFASRRQRVKKRSIGPVWVPEYSHNLVDGRGIPYWTGREALCFLVANQKYVGKPYDYPYENPFHYIEVRGADNLPISRPAVPPNCEVNTYDWDEFEREACLL